MQQRRYSARPYRQRQPELPIRAQAVAAVTAQSHQFKRLFRKVTPVGLTHQYCMESRADLRGEKSSNMVRGVG